MNLLISIFALGVGGAPASAGCATPPAIVLSAPEEAVNAPAHGGELAVPIKVSISGCGAITGRARLSSSQGAGVLDAQPKALVAGVNDWSARLEAKSSTSAARMYLISASVANEAGTASLPPTSIAYVRKTVAGESSGSLFSRGYIDAQIAANCSPTARTVQFVPQPGRNSEILNAMLNESDEPVRVLLPAETIELEKPITFNKPNKVLEGQRTLAGSTVLKIKPDFEWTTRCRYIHDRADTGALRTYYGLKINGKPASTVPTFSGRLMYGGALTINANCTMLEHMGVDGSKIPRELVPSETGMHDVTRADGSVVKDCDVPEELLEGLSAEQRAERIEWYRVAKERYGARPSTSAAADKLNPILIRVSSNEGRLDLTHRRLPNSNAALEKIATAVLKPVEYVRIRDISINGWAPSDVKEVCTNVPPGPYALAHGIETASDRSSRYVSIQDVQFKGSSCRETQGIGFNSSLYQSQPASMIEVLGRPNGASYTTRLESAYYGLWFAGAKDVLIDGVHIKNATRSAIFAHTGDLKNGIKVTLRNVLAERSAASRARVDEFFGQITLSGRSPTYYTASLNRLLTEEAQPPDTSGSVVYGARPLGVVLSPTPAAHNPQYAVKQEPRSIIEMDNVHVKGEPGDVLLKVLEGFHHAKLTRMKFEGGDIGVLSDQLILQSGYCPAIFNAYNNSLPAASRIAPVQWEALHPECPATTNGTHTYYFTVPMFHKHALMLKATDPAPANWSNYPSTWTAQDLISSLGLEHRLSIQGEFVGQSSVAIRFAQGTLEVADSKFSGSPAARTMIEIGPKTRDLRFTGNTYHSPAPGAFLSFSHSMLDHFDNANEKLKSPSTEGPWQDVLVDGNSPQAGSVMVKVATFTSTVPALRFTAADGPEPKSFLLPGGRTGGKFAAGSKLHIAPNLVPQADPICVVARSGHLTWTTWDNLQSRANFTAYPGLQIIHGGVVYRAARQHVVAACASGPTTACAPYWEKLDGPALVCES